MFSIICNEVMVNSRRGEFEEVTLKRLYKSNIIYKPSQLNPFCSPATFQSFFLLTVIVSASPATAINQFN